MSDTATVPQIIAPGTTQSLQDARDIISNYLRQANLAGLVPWAWSQLTSGATADQVKTELYDQPAFQTRFPQIAARQKAGLPPVSVDDILNYEQQASQLEQATGLPQGFINTANEMTNNVSFNELQSRVQDHYQKVIDAPAEVQQKFGEWFGPNGQAALLSYMLDPTKALPILDRQLAAAQVGGTAQRYGLDIGQQQANLLGTIHDPNASIYQMGQLEQGFQQAAAQRPLYQELTGENHDLTAESGVSAAFGLDPNSALAIAQRLQQRVAAGKGQGGAAASERGLIGAGAAQHA